MSTTNWINHITPKSVQRTDKSQLRISVVSMEGKDEKNVSLREFAKYVKADEKKSGVTIEEVDYRPNANGCTFSLDVIDAIISALQEVRAEMLEEKPAKKKGIKKAN